MSLPEEDAMNIRDKAISELNLEELIKEATLKTLID